MSSHRIRTIPKVITWEQKKTLKRLIKTLEDMGKTIKNAHAQDYLSKAITPLIQLVVNR